MDSYLAPAFIFDREMGFTDLCERLVNQDTAEEAASHVIEESERNPTHYRADQIDFLALAILHAGHEQVFLRLLHYFADSAPRQEYTLLISHLALYYLQKSVGQKASSGNREKSQSYLSLVFSMDTSAPLGLICRAYFFLFDGDTKQASNFLDLAGKHANETPCFIPISLYTKFGFALCDYEAGYYKEAARKFFDLLKLHARDLPLLRLGLGMALYKDKSQTHARLAFERAKDFDPKNPATLTALAIYNYNLHKGQDNFWTHCVELMGAIFEVDQNYPPYNILMAELNFTDSKNPALSRKSAAKAHRFATTSRMQAESIYLATRTKHIEDAFSPQAVAQLKNLYEKVLDENPNHAQSCYAIAQFLVHEDKYDAAIPYLQRCLKELPDRFEPNYLMGIVYSFKFQANEKERVLADQAIEFFNKALRVEANEGDSFDTSELWIIYYHMGLLRMKCEEFDEASTCFRKSISHLRKNDQVPGDDLIILHGASTFQNREYEEAIQIFETVSNKDAPVFRFNYARCLEERNKRMEAKEIYQQLIDEFDEFPEPYFRLGAIAEKEHQDSKAEEYYQAVITDVETQHEVAYLYLGHLANKKKDVREAYNFYRKARQGLGVSLYATIASGNAYLSYAQESRHTPVDREKHIRYALTKYAEALGTEPRCVAAANGMAICWMLLGFTDEAKDVLHMVKDYLPDVHSTWENLGHAYMRERNFISARQLFEDCNKQFFDSTNHGLLIQCYYTAKQENNFELCVDYSQQLIQFDPTNSTYWGYLASSLYKYVSSESSLHRLRDTVPGSLIISRWIRQAQRAHSLFVAVESDDLPEEQQKSNAFRKREIHEKLIPHLEKLYKHAIDKESRAPVLSEAALSTYAAGTEVDDSEKPPLTE